MSSEMLGALAFTALVVMVMFGLSFALAIWIEKRKEKRLQALSLFGVRRGYEVIDEERMESLNPPPPPVPILIGSNARIPILLKRSSMGGEDFVGDLLYEVRGRHGPRTISQTVALSCRESRRLPRFNIRPLNFGMRLFHWFYAGDVDFPAHRAFAKRFAVDTLAESQVRDFLTEEKLVFLEKHSRFLIEAGDQWVVIYRKGKTVSIDRMEEFIREAETIFSIFDS
jgi:hypothetical protein